MRLLEAAHRARRILGKSPTYVARRVFQEGERELDRFLAPMRERRLDRRRLLALARTSSVDELWARLRARPFPAWTSAIDPQVLDRIAPGESARIRAAAQLACARTVDLLGTGPVALGQPIDWARDYRVGMGWPTGFARAIDYVNRDRPSDVKIPWEISRLQWLIPAGQAYLLDADERYAVATRAILDEWIDANPLAYTVNWSCTMEAAMRLFTWTWLFHAFAGSPSWRDEGFRIRFLAALYLHGDFTLRHIEKADVNGNHYTADLAGLTMAGHFFGEVGDAGRWLEVGWSGLEQEITTQVFADGVDFEASVPYHRLVFELFLWPALFRKACGANLPGSYVERLRAMARFTAAYARTDGTGPLWGDADDARALPFGGQGRGDHRYLIGLAAAAFGDAGLAAQFSGPRAELVWALGPEQAAAFAPVASRDVPSTAFAHGGVYIMRTRDHHVFIDCGPVGLAGRGGHGHNDALSFEAWLDGAPLVTDRGSFVYTASFDGRNEFRATRSHNTPWVDHAEMNRFDPDNLWSLQDDARAECTQWQSGETKDVFAGRHHGYRRLGVDVARTISLDKASGRLEIADVIDGQGEHDVVVPLHLAPGVMVDRSGAEIRLCSAGRAFLLGASGDGWDLEIEPTTVSPSYGVVVPSVRLAWRRLGALPARLTVTIEPDGNDTACAP
ncbi:alginate lyase family protein [Bradyrhizobium sp.]|uniref:alginate lyase family protein n=1 Tax=Bradyrhizobium sp. TaxID=376 RepID=UPI00238F7209|nr:alginate lyase family protein [Bradyrhizobium sp.]MDE2376698.1 alginate lyase family protein [Bradyrhizobium sp.]